MTCTVIVLSVLLAVGIGVVVLLFKYRGKA
jgi:hypothetical protein